MWREWTPWHHSNPKVGQGEKSAGRVGRPILAAAGFSRLPVLPSPPGDIQAPPPLHEISRADGPQRQTTRDDGLSWSIPPSLGKTWRILEISFSQKQLSHSRRSADRGNRSARPAVRFRINNSWKLSRYVIRSRLPSKACEACWNRRMACA